MSPQPCEQQSKHRHLTADSCTGLSCVSHHCEVPVQHYALRCYRCHNVQQVAVLLLLPAAAVLQALPGVSSVAQALLPPPCFDIAGLEEPAFCLRLRACVLA